MSNKGNKSIQSYEDISRRALHVSVSLDQLNQCLKEHCSFQRKRYLNAGIQVLLKELKYLCSKEQRIRRFNSTGFVFYCSVVSKCIEDFNIKLDKV